MSKSIYVCIEIHTDMESIWKRTQDPSLHERWDLRFTSIAYLPKDDEDEPQRFAYTTKLGFGLGISGWGESIATHNEDQSRTSSLRFGSVEALSLIREGGGYWKYTESQTGIVFETGYDYECRWGVIGRFIDSVVFRPFIGWATAWSFDRLRLWIEKGVDPMLLMLRSIVHSVCRLGLAAIFAWHGIVPKLVAHHPQEQQLIEASGFSPDVSGWLVTIAGVLEILFAIVLVVLWRVRWLYAVTGIALIALMLTAIIADSGLLIHPFGPVTLTIAMLAMCVLGWVACVDLPSARRCSRSKKLNQRERKHK